MYLFYLLGLTQKYSRFSYSVNTGSVDDFEDCKGITHLLEHCLTGVNSDLLKYIYSHGGYIIACTDECSMTFEYLILKEYFDESLKLLFDAFNNPEFSSKSVRDEVHLVDDEFNYRSTCHSKTANLISEINELGVFTTGNKTTLLIEKITDRLKDLFNKNFFKYDISIFCISDTPTKAIKRHKLNIPKKIQHRAKKTLLTDYYNIEERLFLIQASSNLLFLKIKIPLEETPVLLNFLIDKYLTNLQAIEKAVIKSQYTVDYMNMYHIVNIAIFTVQNQNVHPVYIINTFIDIVKTTKIQKSEYEAVLKEAYNSVARDIKPLDFLSYSNIHRYIQFKPHLFNENFNKNRLLTFNKYQFLNLIKHLTDLSNYSALYECLITPDLSYTTYSGIPYKNIKRGRSAYYFTPCNPKETSSTEDAKESNLYIVNFRQPSEMNPANTKSSNERSTDTKISSKRSEIGLFNPENLIDMSYNEYLESPSVSCAAHSENDHYEISQSETHKIHYIHLHDTNDKILVIQFFINRDYDDFKRLIYLMGCLEISLNSQFKLHKSNRVSFRIKHNMLEIIMKKSNDKNFRLLIIKHIGNCIETLLGYSGYIRRHSDQLISTKMLEIAETVYEKKH